MLYFRIRTADNGTHPANATVYNIVVQRPVTRTITTPEYVVDGFVSKSPYRRFLILGDSNRTPFLIILNSQPDEFFEIGRAHV